MVIRVFDSGEALGEAAAAHAASVVSAAIGRPRQGAGRSSRRARRSSRFLAALAGRGRRLDRTTFFHLDEYIGLDESHPASFRRYLRERVQAAASPRAVRVSWTGRGRSRGRVPARSRRSCARRRSTSRCVGIGENGHLAFNDPPADFERRGPTSWWTSTRRAGASRSARAGSRRVDEVPRRAISMSIPQNPPGARGPLRRARTRGRHGPCTNPWTGRSRRSPRPRRCSGTP